ncbi:MAG TPA: SDR family NAD(P)-dependent oxidoreductase [Candidatus Binatia bacterium]|nr:SDR family NAD(P)-dependent oxidoreductase [Candidatus Binatia bacterium]
MIRLDDKVAIVTGGGRGLGRAYALALARVGARVVVNDLGVQVDGSAAGDDSAGAVVSAIRRAGGHAIANTESVTDPAGVERLFESALALFHRVDILINNAGIVRSRPLAEMRVDDFDEVVAVHLRGTFLCTRAAIRTMCAAGRGGRIINTTSGQAYGAPAAGTANYAAAKGGIIALTGVTAVEGAPHGITCNAVSPLARTRMSAHYLAGQSDAHLEPDAIAPLVVFLASDAAVKITAKVWRVARNEIALVDASIGRALRPRHECWTAEELADRIGEIGVEVT